MVSTLDAIRYKVITAALRPGPAFSLPIVRVLLLARPVRRSPNVLRLVSPLRGGTRSRAVVTLCTVRVTGATALALQCAALRSPFLLDGHLACATCQRSGGRRRTRCGLWAVCGCGGDGPSRLHPRHVAPVRGDVLNDKPKGPCGLQRLPSFGGHTVDL